MQRIDLAYFYRLSLTFHALKSLEPCEDVIDVWFDLLKAQQALEALFAPGPMRGCFRSCYASGVELHRAIKAIADRNFGEQFTQNDKAKIVQELSVFETILQSELSIADAYYVVEKRGYSTIKLISGGEVLFSPELPEKVPEAVSDLREAARCLAFELPTAAGFHTLRAVEAVLRRYWTAVTGNDVKPKQRNIGVYLSALKKEGCGDPKVIAALQQLKDLHRNVLFHPEDSLDTDGAVALLGISQSVVAAMLQVIPVVAFDHVPEQEMSAIDATSNSGGEAEEGELRDIGNALALLSGGSA